jgi:hypothetical protein
MLNNLNILWGLVILVIILNFVIYLTEPLKYTEEDKCLKIPCRNFILFNQLFGYFFDICIIIVLAKLSGFKETSIIFIMLIFFSFIIIVSWFSALPVVKDGTINPPPKLYIKKSARITLHFIILLLDLLIFVVLFMDRAGIGNDKTISAGEGIFRNKGYGFTNLINTRFGGNVDNNRFVFACGWVSFLGIFQNIYNLIVSTEFHPTNYNLPLSWRL